MTIYRRDGLIGRRISPGGLPGRISLLTPSTVAARIGGLLVVARRVRCLLICAVTTRPRIIAVWENCVATKAAGERGRRGGKNRGVHRCTRRSRAGRVRSRSERVKDNRHRQRVDGQRAVDVTDRVIRGGLARRDDRISPGSHGAL
jgi:hypothetical protein